MVVLTNTEHTEPLMRKVQDVSMTSVKTKGGSYGLLVILQWKLLPNLEIVAGMWGVVPFSKKLYYSELWRSLIFATLGSRLLPIIKNTLNVSLAVTVVMLV